MLRLALAIIAILTAAACGSNVPPTPTPRPCWVAYSGEFRLTVEDEAEPSSIQLVDTARTIDARLSAMGLALFTVGTRPPNIVTVALQALEDANLDEVGRLIRAIGDLEFVPVPPEELVEVGDLIPLSLAPLFGREGISSATPGFSANDQPTLDFVLTEAAAATLDAHAGQHVGEQLAIVADGIVISAPTLNSRSFEGRLQISGFRTEMERSRLITLLRLPPLPGELEEVSLEEIQPAPGCVSGG